MINKIKEFFKMRKRVKRLKKIYPDCKIIVQKESKKIFILKEEVVSYLKQCPDHCPNCKEKMCKAPLNGEYTCHKCNCTMDAITGDIIYSGYPNHMKGFYPC